jgi:hypothetical protein
MDHISYASGNLVHPYEEVISPLEPNMRRDELISTIKHPVG